MKDYECVLINSCGDCTDNYIITLNKQMTVSEFINQWIINNNDLFGVIDIIQNGESSLDSIYYCKYYRGRIETNTISIMLNKKVITKITANGGWGLMNVVVTV